MPSYFATLIHGKTYQLGTVEFKRDVELPVDRSTYNYLKQLTDFFSVRDVRDKVEAPPVEQPEVDNKPLVVEVPIGGTNTTPKAPPPPPAPPKPIKPKKIKPPKNGPIEVADLKNYVEG